MKPDTESVQSPKVEQNRTLIIEVNRLFPKGNQGRGFALMLVSVAHNEIAKAIKKEQYRILKQLRKQENCQAVITELEDILGITEANKYARHGHQENNS